jgi:hypothetical protein
MENQEQSGQVQLRLVNHNQSINGIYNKKNLKNLYSPPKNKNTTIFNGINLLLAILFSSATVILPANVLQTTRKKKSLLFFT